MGQKGGVDKDYFNVLHLFDSYNGATAPIYLRDSQGRLSATSALYGNEGTMWGVAHMSGGGKEDSSFGGGSVSKETAYLIYLLVKRSINAGNFKVPIEEVHE